MENPIQPLCRDARGVIRFKKNTLVDALLLHGQSTGFGLNELACKFHGPEHKGDWQQLAQLIGYSVDGYGTLSYVTDEAYAAAEALVEGL